MPNKITTQNESWVITTPLIMVCSNALGTPIFTLSLEVSDFAISREGYV